MKSKKWSPKDSFNHTIFLVNEQSGGLLYISNWVLFIKKLHQLLLY